MEQKKKSARTMRVLGTLLEGSGKYFAVCILLGLLLTAGVIDGAPVSR